MDSDRRSAQVERLEVVDTGRRRRWSEDEKLKIVLESLQAPRHRAAVWRFALIAAAMATVVSA
ncbi:transposase-like protein [Bradyrhizobium sp. USDA 4448]